MVINYQDNNTSSITLERVALKTAKDYYNDDENGDTARKTANFFCCNLQQIMQLPVMQFISYTSVGYDGVQSGHGTKESGCDNRYRTEDLVELHTQIMSSLLQKVLAQRALTDDIRAGLVDLNECHTFQRSEDSGALSELSEMIQISSHHDHDDGSISSRSLEAGFENATALAEAVRTQLHLFITQVASMYKNNAFHNFEHASHVALGAYKLLRRLVAQENATANATLDKGREGCSVSPWRNLPFDLSQSTNALASDALAQFAVVFSALLHDVEHEGVPNTQLAKEKPEIAERYQHKSLAEQNSVHIGWDLLGKDCFRDLRACIFPTGNDRLRFRKMYENVVMATDICDPSLQSFQKKKIDKDFSDLEEYEERNRRATVAMDLFIQVSDISHTMQSFSVYRTWNERLYQEMYSAYLKGRAESDPSENWYKGEFGFYDFHIIPLLMKIKETGVLGLAADVLLQNARNNRLEWEKAGEERCTSMQERVQERLRVEEPDYCTTSTFSLCCGSRTLLVGVVLTRANGESDSGETDPEGHKANGRISCLRSRAKTS